MYSNTTSIETERSNSLIFSKPIQILTPMNMTTGGSESTTLNSNGIISYIDSTNSSEHKLKSSNYLDDLDQIEPLTPTLNLFAQMNIEASVNDTNESNITRKLKKSKSFKSSIPKKLQFKNDSTTNDNVPQQTEKNSIDNKDLQKRRSSTNLHEKLNQLKSDELKKRRMNSLGNQKKKVIPDTSYVVKFLKLTSKISRFKAKLHTFLERPSGTKGFIYRLFTFTIIFGSIVTGALTTIKSVDNWSLKVLFWYEIFATSYFSFEYVLRVWSVGHRSSFKGIFGRIKYALRPLQIIEMTLIIISITILSTGSQMRHFSDEILFKSSALSALRFFQIFRFLYIDRQAQTWVILSKVIKQHRFELLSSVYIGVIILLFSSYFILVFEKPYSEEADDNHFHSYADAIYWSIITMATIGYGDRSPRTFMGKIISTTLCIVGVAFWTLPGGIIGSGFALKVEQKNKKKQFNRLIPAAANLIQAWWRMKSTIFISSSNASSLIATVSTFDISKPIYSSSLRRLRKQLNPSNYEEMSTLFSGLDQPSPTKTKELKNTNQDKNTNSLSNENTDEKSKILPSKSSSNQMSSHSSNFSHYNEDGSILLKLSPEHLILIRTILLLKFFRAQHKFKLAFKPYDFKDVIEQYTQGNMDILLKMKDLQRKIDQVNSNATVNRNLLTTDYNYVPSYPYQNGSSPNTNKSRSPNLNQSRIPSPPSPTLSSNHNQLNQAQMQNLSSAWSYQNQDTLINRSLSFKRKRLFSTDQTSLNDPTIQLNNRINRIESELDVLSRKMDKLIDLSLMNNQPRFTLSESSNQ